MLYRALVTFVLGSRIPIGVEGSPWPSKLSRHELNLDVESIGSASFPIHHETGVPGCSAEPIECVLLNEDDRSVYNDCGIVLQPTDDGWCRLPLIGSDNPKKYEQDICCGEDLADCCKLRVRSMVGIAALSFVLVFIATWAIFCCKDKLCQNRACKLGRCACPLRRGKKIEQEDQTKTSSTFKTEGSEDLAPRTNSVPTKEGYRLAKLLAKESKKRRKKAAKKMDQIKAYLARPRSPTKRMYVRQADTAASIEGQIPPSLTSAVVVRGRTDDAESQAPVRSVVKAPSSSCGKSIFVATTAPTPKEIEPIKTEKAVKIELCWDHLDLEEL